MAAVAPLVMATGTGRCGTSSVAHMLGAAGVPASHEAYWHPTPRPAGVVDVSALAAPSAAAWSGPVLHIVRHPLAVIGSFAGFGFWSNPGARWRVGVEGRFVAEHFRFDDDDPWGTAARFYVEWNRMVEAAPGEYRRVRVGEIAAADLLWVAERAGVPVSEMNAESAVRMVPATTNTRRRGRVTVGWEDVPFRALREIADEYGFTT